MPTPDGHAAVAGDVMIVNMKGFEKNPDGSAGAPLPAIAGGDGVEIILETGTWPQQACSTPQCCFHIHVLDYIHLSSALLCVSPKCDDGLQASLWRGWWRR